MPRGRADGLVTFFLLTFGIAWGLWALAGVFDDGTTLSVPLRVVFLLGVFAPGIAAITLSAITGGRKEVGTLLRQIAQFDVPVRYFVIAIGFMASVKLFAATLIRVSTGAWPAFGSEPVLLMFGAILVSVWAQAGEELGWRGYALPRLAARIGFGPASVVIGVIWAVWHLPLFYTPAGDTFGQSFLVYLTQVTALSVVLGWLYLRTGGSLFLVMLMHAAVNNTTNIVPSRNPTVGEVFTFDATPVAWTTASILWGVAAVLLWRMRGARLE
jgi:membrane protease YdiL (CAAX protease family)